MSKAWQLPNVAWDIWRNTHRNVAVSTLRQQARLLDLVEFARACAPFYRQHYGRLPMKKSDLHLLPPVTKPELMAHFDEWVTDPNVSRAGVADFLANKTLVGQRYLDRFAVWSTSGVTGKPDIFVQDSRALAVYSAIIAARGYRWLTPGRLWSLLKGGGRYALVAATGEHFTLTDYMERVRRSSPLVG